jgi:outer membrane protein
LKLILRLAEAGVLGVCLTCAAHATDLEDVYRLSIDHDPRLQAARFQYEAAKEAVPQARAQLLPNLNLELEHLETEQDIRSSDNAVFGSGRSDFPTDRYGLTLSQPIFRFADWQRLKQSHAEVAQALAEYTAEEQQLILRVAEAYLGVLAAQDNVRFTEAEQAAVGRQRELAATRRTAGLAPRTDEYDANARYAVVVANAVEAQNQLDDAYQALLESAGTLITDVAPLTDEIPLESPNPSNVDDWVERALEQNLGLIARMQALEVAQHEVRRQSADRYPTVDFLARLDNRDTEGSLFGGGSEVETADFGIQFRVPLYLGGSTGSRVRQASLVVDQVVEEVKLERLIVARRARSAYLGVLSGISRTEALGESLLAQKSALDAKQRGYNSGINTTLDVLDAERDLYLIRRDRAQARYDYLLSTLRLKQATGTLSTDDLARINDMLTDDGT